MSILVRLVFAGAATALVACGSVSSHNADAPLGGGDFSVAVSPASLDIPVTGTGMANVTIDRTGMVGDIMLSAQNVPTGITVTFATNPVTTAAAASAVTVTVAAGTPVGANQITIVGDSGGTQHSTTLTVNATTITVAGTVAGGRSGITVGLVGKPSVVSDASGNFTFTNVTPPYDLYTYANSFLVGSHGVYYYEGLTRTDPIIPAASSFLIVFPIQTSGTVTGSHSGTGNTTSPTEIMWTSGSNTTTATNPYTFTASWPSAATNSGTLYGFQWTTKASGAPDTRLGYGATPATISQNVSNTVNLTFAAPTTAAITGTITPPAGFPAPTVQLSQQVANTSFSLWSTTTTTADSTIPIVGAGVAAFFASTTTGGATSAFVHPALNAATDVSYTLPAPALLTAPVNAATNVDTTTPFSYTVPANTLSQVSISTGGTTKIFYEVYTMSGTSHIPTVTEAPVPSNQSFSWSVQTFAPFASTDDAATSPGPQNAGIVFTGTTHASTASASNTFTSKP